ncbi:helix-turn-helix domain-containing protein [Halobacterium jilantaiense]|uniref:HTH DNA binding domain-containing protein n=1 Tax=Halobacterium jilantaiense TaxID=355548 RepID=A0A1I0PMM9_9EURY|nr:helix-turn-helix domain-containing protein [Halobacterium jilantaiense]SEW15612.1 HTH DNA binding domain-containing protein [Halobacterium jilantaiense]
MRRVSLRTDYPPARRHALHQEVVERSGVGRVDLLVWGPAGSATQFQWFDADADTTAALLDAVSAVEQRRLVAGDGGTYAFTRQSEFAFDPDLLAVVASADVAFFPPVSFHGDGTATVDAVGEDDRLAALVDALAAHADVTVESVRDFHRGGAPAALTDRQRAALDAAVAAGYYEVPREGSVADVADALDCSTSTAGELLRKAEARVVTALVD